MKTLNKKITVYEFEELSSGAKDNAKNCYLDAYNYEIEDSYIYDIESGLNATFPNSDLGYEYSLGYCQGDGFNLFGKLSLEDAFNHWDSPFTWQEKVDLYHYADVCGGLVLPRNETHYAYCFVNRLSISEDWVYELEDENEECDPLLIQKFENWIIEKVSDLCSVLERKGYNELYEINDYNMKRVCKEYGLVFLKDGTLFNERKFNQQYGQ